MDRLIKAHQPSPSTTRVGKGTGLGLATVYGIVTQSGGAIRVDSEPGQGAVFTIDLPRVDAPADLRGDPGIPDAAPHGSETVLLVEDEPEVRGLARDILHQQGYTVLEAADGDEALRIGREHGGPIHLLVTDVVMPQMGGRELADHLEAGRRETRCSTCRLHRRRHPASGVSETGTAFLPKPFTPRTSPTRSASPRRRAGERRPLAQIVQPGREPHDPRRAWISLSRQRRDRRLERLDRLLHVRSSWRWRGRTSTPAEEPRSRRSGRIG